MRNERMKDLPIFAKMEEILAAVRRNQVTIVIGETGSGKSTQLPGFLYANGIAGTGAIAVTEPRRIAAISLARFVANELGVALGDEVGYQVRFDKKTSGRTDVPVETARAIQKKWAVDAEKNGWVLLEPMKGEHDWRIFARIPGGSTCEVNTIIGDVYVAAGGGRKYYCEIREGGWESSRTAVPKFEYFNLGGEEAEKKAVEKAAPEVVVDAVTAFNQKFGAVKTQRKK